MQRSDEDGADARPHPLEGGGVGGTPSSLARLEPWAAGLALALGVVSLFWLVATDYDARADAALYLETARSLLRGEGYAYLGEPFTLRPPGFPLLIAPVLALVGSDFTALHASVSVWGLLALVLLFALVRTRIAWPLALVVTIAIWLNPGFRQLCNSVMSDVPGAAFLLGTLLAERHARRAPSPGRNAAVAVLAALAFWVRPMNGLLAPAIVLGRLAGAVGRAEPQALREAVRSSASFALAFTILVAPWIGWSAARAPAGAVDQTKLHSFATAMLREDAGDPASRPLGVAEIAARIPLRARQTVGVLGQHLTSELRGRGDDPQLSAATVAMGCFLLAALVFAAIRHREAQDWLALGAVALLLVYYGFQDRLVLPVYLLALPASLELARDAALRLNGDARVGATAATAVLAAALTMPMGAGDRSTVSARATELNALASRLAPVLASDETLATSRGFHLTVLLDRPVYSLVHAVQRNPRHGLERALARYDIDVVVLEEGGAGPAEARMARQLTNRFGPPQPVDGALLWRVTAEAALRRSNR